MSTPMHSAAAPERAEHPRKTMVRETPGEHAVQTFGWLAAHRWLLARRSSQILILTLFLLGPWAGVWWVKGNLNASLTLDILPLTDPYVLLQAVLAGGAIGSTAVLGAVIVALFYALVGGRVYCSWVCPVNILTDTARWMRRKLGLRGTSHPAASLRLWILAATGVAALSSGAIAWELVNPVSMLHRSLIFGGGLAWTIVAAVFLLDLLAGERTWCGHVCPVGAFYGLLGKASLLRVSAPRRDACNDCMDCFAVCPEPKVITPALRGKEGHGPVILASDCTNCGRCIDVCSQKVFRFTHRFDSNVEKSS